MKLSDFKKYYNRKVIIALSAVIVTVLIVIFMLLRSGSSAITTYKVKKGDFVIDISTTGELQAAKSVSVPVPANVWGNIRITKLADDGTMVNEDDFLVQFDTSEAENNVKQRQNELDNANAELRSMKANIESTQKQNENNYLIQQYNYEQAKLRFQQMKYEAEARKQEQEIEFKKAELTLQQAKEQIESQKTIDEANTKKSELKVKQCEMNLKRAQDQLNALTLRAPKKGMVVLQKIWSENGFNKVKIGDTPHRGMELVSIPDLSVMVVKTKINEVDITRVKVGQKSVITLDAIPGPNFYGKLTNISTLARNEQGKDMKVFDAEITFDNSDNRLKPGMTAQCKIVTGIIPDVLSIPLEAVFEKEDTTIVYVKKWKFDKHKVKIGQKNSDFIIIENGLRLGDNVALSDPTMTLQELGGEEKQSKESRKVPANGTK
jgi:HlyD family secretion protein